MPAKIVTVHWLFTAAEYAIAERTLCRVPSEELRVAQPIVHRPVIRLGSRLHECVSCAKIGLGIT